MKRNLILSKQFPQATGFEIKAEDPFVLDDDKHLRYFIEAQEGSGRGPSYTSTDVVNDLYFPPMQETPYDIFSLQQQASQSIPDMQFPPVTRQYQAVQTVNHFNMPNTMHANEQLLARTNQNSVPMQQFNHPNHLRQIKEEPITHRTPQYVQTISPIPHQQATPISPMHHQTLPISPMHHQTLPISPMHHQTLPITPMHHQTLPISPMHHQTLPITPMHHQTLPISPMHHQTLPITPMHHQTLPITPMHHQTLPISPNDASPSPSTSLLNPLPQLSALDVMSFDSTPDIFF